ncbi:hypothetical protein F4779DRAFT_352180 [Xylariaceae sp. FL0662B]|nr:hypothetical protein F4779DRAFT_352180 [Xylariaceae sp. FL0662B]
MEALQLAQMLADLNDLQAAPDQSASKALVGANSTLNHQDQSQAHQRPRSLAIDGRTTSTPAGRSLTDKFGRRMFTPPLTRTNSATPTTVPGTPARGFKPDTDSDIDKATTLLSLYEIRAKLKEQDNSGLMKAREKISALAAKQQPPKSSSPPRGDRKEASHFNYPK